MLAVILRTYKPSVLARLPDQLTLLVLSSQLECFYFLKQSFPPRAEKAGTARHTLCMSAASGPAESDTWKAFRKDAAVGTSVGLTDIALVYPLAVLATRREAGVSMREALKQGRFWAGGWTAGSLLVPYSIVVEGGSNVIRRTVCAATGIDARSWQGDVASAVGTASVVTYFGLQPIEKKLVMDQLLEEQGGGAVAAKRRRGNPISAPVKEIYQYAQLHGVRALYGGAVPLLCRELCYITAITIANPLVTSWVEKPGKHGGSAHAPLFGLLGAFSVGLTAGLVTAPFQTLNAVMKSESHRGKSMRALLRDMFGNGMAAGVHRLWYGAATRSLRTAGAGMLYFTYRKIFE